jgi:hypothetical protein
MGNYANRVPLSSEDDYVRKILLVRTGRQGGQQCTIHGEPSAGCRPMTVGADVEGPRTSPMNVIEGSLAIGGRATLSISDTKRGRAK